MVTGSGSTVQQKAAVGKRAARAAHGAGEAEELALASAQVLAVLGHGRVEAPACRRHAAHRRREAALAERYPERAVTARPARPARPGVGVVGRALSGPKIRPDCA
jgi:hypothetical protein